MARKSEPMAYAERCDTNFYKSFTKVKEKKCYYCKEKFTRYTNEMDYIQKIGEKKFEFCSYNCRSKFRKEHEQEIREQNDILAYDKIKASVLNKSRNKTTTNPNRVSNRTLPYECYVDGVRYASMQEASRKIFDSRNVIPNARYRKNTNEFDYNGHHIKVIPIEVNDEISK